MGVLTPNHQVMTHHDTKHSKHLPQSTTWDTHRLSARRNEHLNAAHKLERNHSMDKFSLEIPLKLVETC